MKWVEAIERVLKENGIPMNYEVIAREIFRKGYKEKDAPFTVNPLLNKDENRARFMSLDEGNYMLVDTLHGSSALYAQGDPKYKHVSDFIKFPDNLSQSDKELLDKERLLDLIVNFRLPLIKREVCFADIQGNLDVEFCDKKKSCSQLVDAAILREKLEELRIHITELEAEIEKERNNPENLDLKKNLLERMRSFAQKIEGYLDAHRDKVKVNVPLLGEFVESEPKPKVVIYYNNIQDIYGSGWKEVMVGVFVHEMFHAWNYFNAVRMKSSVLAIEEPMVEFETLYFLKELAAFTSSQSLSLKGEVERVYEDRKCRVQNKQQSIGDVAAYGFGYYLFENLKDYDYESRHWIEAYSEKSDSINIKDLSVDNAIDALIPVYPFGLEKDVMKWFRNIIFYGYTSPVIAGKSAKNFNAMNDVIYKIRVNRPCRLFIDEEEVMPLKENVLTKITLPEGEYLRKVVAEDDSTVFDEKVISLFHPKVDIIALDAIALEEAKRKALPDEIYQSNLYFKPTKDRLSVVVNGKKEYVDAINIPDQIGYAGYVYPVTAVVLTARDLKSITIPNSVKYINFKGCSSLTSITIPNSVRDIFFEGCSSLTSITIPDSVTSIDFYAFEGCSSLTAIDYVGTKKQWEKIMKHEFWKPLYERIVVHCTDGDVSCY